MLRSVNISNTGMVNFQVLNGDTEMFDKEY